MRKGEKIDQNIMQGGNIYNLFVEFMNISNLQQLSVNNLFPNIDNL